MSTFISSHFASLKPWVTHKTRYKETKECWQNSRVLLPSRRKFEEHIWPLQANRGKQSTLRKKAHLSPQFDNLLLVTSLVFFALFLSQLGHSVAYDVLNSAPDRFHGSLRRSLWICTDMYKQNFLGKIIFFLKKWSVKPSYALIWYLRHCCKYCPGTG